MFNVRVTMGHGPAQAQEEPAEKRRSSRFCLSSQIHFTKKLNKNTGNFRVLASCFVMKCEVVIVLDIYKKLLGKSAV